MNYRYWKIEGHGYIGDSSFQQIYEKKIPIGYIGRRQIKKILMCLTAKEDLDFDEIVGAYATRRTKIPNNLLEVRLERKRNGSPQIYHCGDNSHFTAQMVKE